MTESLFTAHRLVRKKNINNTVSSKPFSSKLGNVAGQAAYCGGMAALGVAGRGFARGAVHAGRATFYNAGGAVHAGRAVFNARPGQMAGRVAQAAARPAIRRAMGA